MLKHPIPWTKNHRIQKTCVKIMHKTIGGFIQSNIGSKTKIFWGAALDSIKWGYGCSSNPLVTMWKEYSTTQHSLVNKLFLVLHMLAKMEEEAKKVRQNLRAPQDRKNMYADEKRTYKEFRLGDHVYL